MTQHIVGYENAVYYSKISNQVFGDNLLSLKNLIDDEIDFIGNFQNAKCSQDKNIDYNNLDFLDQMIDNIICLDTYNNKKLTNQYDTAKNFITKYSQK